MLSFSLSLKHPPLTSSKPTTQSKVKAFLMMAMMSAEVISSNEDLLTQILLLLPAKPLLKFKCVSKQWLSLISNPKFTVTHTRHHHHTPNLTPIALLLNKTYTPTPEFQIVPLKQHDTVCKVPFLDYLNVPRIKLQQSCNGLLLCTSGFLLPLSKQKWKKLYSPMADFSSSVVTEDDCGIRYFICNPTTKKFKQLSFPSHQFKDSLVALNLAFDPFKSAHYKVISICKVKEYTHSTYRFRIDMYSSETDSWNLLGITFNEPDGMGLNDAVFCNGAIHWDSYDVNSLYFDVDNQCLKTMPMPVLRDGLHYRDVQYFGESCGHLHLVVTNNPNALKFNVLEMAADYSQWFVRYHVDLDALTVAIPELIWYRGGNGYPFSILGIIRAEKEEESTVVLFVDHKAVSYNPYNGIAKKLCDLQPGARLTSFPFDYESYLALMYFETISCV